ncbi:MAG: hypothetical protein E6J90_27805 [Deltaproteobacteria bacterium]|nr:MAG: hypothetical protein E6J90_27805 [Deltaproteobacteria bacterium]TMQ17809.1 MAG: hypothetical protein E6J91_09315 [Deltaproteobacteria bacterium]
MGFRFERRAASRKARTGLASWFGKPPGAREVGERLRRLVPRLWPGVEITAAGKLRAELHPLASPLTIEVADDASLWVRGEAGSVGPGYCDEAVARLAPVLDEIDYAWDEADDVRDAMARWLAAELAAGKTRIGMPAGRVFLVDAAVQTAMGPRDAAWRDAVLADPGAGGDAFAWWERGPGQLERSRALLAMWHEVPWREPIDKAEMAVMKRVDADLRAARKADRELALPYAEWAELVANLGDDERAAELRGRATGPSRIGYRRFAVEVDVGTGWLAALPGSFTGNRDDSSGYYWATDGDRVIEVTTMETTESDSGKLLDVAPARHPVIERVVDGARHGRAEAYETDGLCVVYGLVAIAPHVVIVTCRASERDPAWGLALWRSLHRA